MTASVGPINLGALAGARIPHWHLCKTGPAWDPTTIPLHLPVFTGWMNGYFIIACTPNGGADSGDVLYSVNGRDWLAVVVVPAGSTFGPTMVLFGNGIFVATTASSTNTYQADNPAGPWVLGTGNPNQFKGTLFPAWFGDGLFVICSGTTAQVFSSPSASNQVTHATPVNFNTGTYDEELGLHLACENLAGNVYSSPDLDTWTLRGATGLTSVKRLSTNGGGRFLAIDGGTQRNYIAYSRDGGVTWLHSTGLPPPAVFYVDMIYVELQRFWILVDNHGHTFISFDDGESWTATLHDLNYILGDNIDWYMASTPGGHTYVAVPIQGIPGTTAAIGTC